MIKSPPLGPGSRVPFSTRLPFRPPHLFASLLLFLLTLLSHANAQTSAPQQLAFAGLRSVAQHGQINAVATDSSGNLYLLLNQNDGVRLLKTDNTANAVLAQTVLGAQGDVGLALALDPTGNLYVTGTTSSTALTATPGAAISTRTDSSTNSFVAGFDPSLNPIFVTFTGGSRIAASAIAATADAVFVTGIIYTSDLPVTSNGVQRSPASGSSQNGFVEKFSSSGATLLYATYLTGAAGDTTPTAIAADASDNAYIGGSTSTPSFPTIAALVPALLSNPSGFLTKLSPAGDSFVASTFIPGTGLTSLALDLNPNLASQTLLASGSVALGQFPVATVVTPLIPTTYQVLLRLPLDLSAVNASTLIAPGTQSFVAAGPANTAWIDGASTFPLFPIAPLSSLGTAYAIRVNAQNIADQTARFGGLPNGNPSFASLPATITSIAVDPAGEPLVAGSIQPTASSSLLATQTYDLSLRNSPTPALPSTLADAELTAATCNGSLCAGSAAFLAKLNPTAAPALAFSAADLPFITLRNLGSSEADNLSLSATNATISSACTATLPPGAECSALLSGGSAGTLTASASNGTSQTITFPAYPSQAPTSTIVFSPKELDFGIQTSTSAPGTRTISIANLGTTSQTFTSALDASARTTSPFTEAATDCTLATTTTSRLLAPGGTCHITIAFSANPAASGDGPLQANWSIGSRDVLLTGYSQAAALSVSASEIDFGTQYSSGLRLPRYLYLSNPSTNAIPHTAASLPTSSPFTLTDSCPSFLLANSVCRIRIDYLSPATISDNSTTLTLDEGLSVLLTGQTLTSPTTGSASTNPNLAITPAAITFADPVVVTSISSTAQTVSITNTGASAVALTLSLTGDFTFVTSCASTLPAMQTCAVSLTFAPSQPGIRQGLLTIASGPSTSPTYVSLSGTGAAILSAGSGALDFGSDPVGQPETRFYKIAGHFPALTVSTTGPWSVVLAEDAGFGPGQPPASSFATSLTGACHICYLGLRFNPAAAGPQSGTVTLSSTVGGSPYVLSLTGSGAPLTGLVFTPGSQSFGTVAVHSTSATLLFTFTNLLPAATSVVVNTPALAGDFTLITTPTGEPPCGGTLSSTASCSIQVVFDPTTTGPRAGTLTLTTSAGSVTGTLIGTASADPGLALTPSSLTFSNVPGTTATRQIVTLTNTGVAPVLVGTPTNTTAAFQSSSNCGTLAPAASCSIAITFLPSASVVQDALLIPVTAASITTPYVVPLTGAYLASSAGLSIVPALASYGPTPVLSVGPTHQFTVTNFTANALTLSLDLPRQFVLVGLPCTDLASNSTCTFSVAFLPLTNGDIPGTIIAQATPADGSAPLTSFAYLDGYGVGQNTLTLTGGLIVDNVFNFNQVTSGQALAQAFTLTNQNPAGTSAITVRRVTSAPPFLSTTSCGDPLSPGASPAQYCTVTVTYSPTNQVASGTASPATSTDTGTLIIESDSASAPIVLNLTGQAGPLPVAAPSSASALATFTLSENSLTFASTQVGDSSAPQSVILTNTGTQTLHLTYTPTADFTITNPCTVVLAAATCTFAVSSTPQTDGAHIAALQLSSDSTTSLEFISLLSTATPASVALSPTSVDFGSLLVGARSTLPVQVSNTGTTPVTFTSVSASGDYSATGACSAPGTTLAPNATCNVEITFTPSTAGARPGTLAVATSATTNPLLITLTGVGNQSKLLITPSALAFGNTAIGVSANLQLSLSNTGTAPINAIALTATGDFIVSNPCAVTTLAPGNSCGVQITFTPAAAALQTGTLTIVSSDTLSPTTIPLTGAGVPAGGGFTLTASPATATVVSGQPASYTLALTPVGGFTGTVALTCTPLTPTQYAACSLLPSALPLSTGTQFSIATINTITSAAALQPLPRNRSFLAILSALLAPCFLLVWRDRLTLHRVRLLVAVLFFCASALIGCGSPGNSGGSTIRYTPAGTYQFQITASSITGSPATESVTLTLVVTPH